MSKPQVSCLLLYIDKFSAFCRQCHSPPSHQEESMQLEVTSLQSPVSYRVHYTSRICLPGSVIFHEGGKGDADQKREENMCFKVHLILTKRKENMQWAYGEMNSIQLKIEAMRNLDDRFKHYKPIQVNLK